MFTLQTLAGFPDQDSYYDMVDCLEEQSIEAKGQRHLSRKGTDLDLVEQFNIYEVSRPVTGGSTVLIGIVRNSIVHLTKEFSALIPALSRGKLHFRSVSGDLFCWHMELKAKMKMSASIVLTQAAT